MELFWGFYKDSWLIDPYPSDMEIQVKRKQDKKGNYYFVTDPSHLTLFFGANPKYIFTEGKYLHEVFISPPGIAVYPEFNGIINGDLIKIDKMEISTTKEFDFNGELNYNKFFGDVEPETYLKNVQEKIYRITDKTYSTNFTPSLYLRKSTVEERLKRLDNIHKYAIYSDYSEMKNDGCKCYWKMDVPPTYKNGFVTIHEPIGNRNITFLTQDSITTKIYDEVQIIDTTRGYFPVPSNISSIIKDGFQIIFRTLPNFNFGTIFSFGVSDNDNKYYGCSFSIDPTAISFVANNGSQRVWEKLAIIDWSFSQCVSIYFKKGILRILIGNTTIINEIDIDTSVEFINNSDFLFAGKIINNHNNPEKVGNVCEFSIFDGEDSVGPDKFMDEDKPFIRPSYLPTIQEEYGVPIIGKGLTFKDDRMFFLPNYGDSPEFKELYEKVDYNVITKHATITKSYKNASTSQRNKVFRLYAIDTSGYKTVLRLDWTRPQDRPQDIIVRDKIFRLPIRTKFFGMIMGDSYISKKFNALTKFTSDTHYPIRIDIDFSVPEYFSEEDVFNFSLRLESLKDFLYYNYKKFRDEK